MILPKITLLLLMYHYKKGFNIEEYRLWIDKRKNPNTQPKHKVLSRQLHLEGEPTLTIHTAGQAVVWEISIREAAMDQNLLNNMNKSDQALVRWLYENDNDIEYYHYKKENKE